jgi:Bifunctional DNA primase/polymerase, N-terminal
VGCEDPHRISRVLDCDGTARWSAPRHDHLGVVRRSILVRNREQDSFTVASRPQSAPWKRHYYFKQTAYSVKTFRTETNVKDLSLLKDGKHPTRYDLKGVGGGGLVVAAGSVRADGEVYAVISDGSVIPVPDWLVDWLCQDTHRYKSELAKARAEQSAKVKAARLEAVRTGAAVVKHDVSEDGIHDFLSSRAGSLARLGTRRSSIERMLAEQAEDFCAGGKAFADSASGKAKFHELAFNPRLRIGDATFFKRLKPTMVGTTIILPPHIPTPKEQRHQVMEDSV